MAVYRADSSSSRVSFPLLKEEIAIDEGSRERETYSTLAAAVLLVEDMSNYWLRSLASAVVIFDGLARLSDDFCFHQKEGGGIGGRRRKEIEVIPVVFLDVYGEEEERNISPSSSYVHRVLWPPVLSGHWKNSEGR